MPALLKLKPFPADFYTRNKPMPCMDPATHQYRQEYPCPAVPCTPCWQHRKAAPQQSTNHHALPMEEDTRYHKSDLTDAEREERAQQTKVCALCLEPYQRGPNRSNTEWALKKYCGFSCAGKAANKARWLAGQDARGERERERQARRERQQETKICLSCHQPFVRGYASPTRWAARRYCGADCVAVANKARG
jgi:hypothetical protein